MTWQMPGPDALWRSGPRTAPLGVVRDGRLVPLHEVSREDFQKLPAILVRLPLDDRES